MWIALNLSTKLPFRTLPPHDCVHESTFYTVLHTFRSVGTEKGAIQILAIPHSVIYVEIEKWPIVFWGWIALHESVYASAECLLVDPDSRPWF
jgi:hypothetical protein